MTQNAEVEAVLKEIALLLEVEGKDEYKARAYYRAVRSIAALGEDIAAIAARGELTQIPGIGKGLAEVIKDYLSTGKVGLLEDLRGRIPVKVMELDSIPSVGPKTMKLVYDELKIIDLGGLKQAADEGQLAGLKGMGKKKEEQIIEGIRLVEAGIGRTLFSDAMPFAERIRNRIAEVPGVNQVEITGSFRRRKETVRDLDVLVDARDPEPVMSAFVSMADVMSVLAQGATKSSVRLKNNLQVDLRVLPAENYGAGLQYFTGSVDHNVKLRSIARKMGLRLNEYGLYKEGEMIAGGTEASIYKKLGLEEIPPELREDTGEVEVAQEGKLPKLLDIKDIKGDLHSHTDKSDGRNSVEEMLDAVSLKRYEYYCVSDHTKSLTIANGMDEGRLLARIDEIDDLNNSGRWKFRILKGAEVDILKNGELDMDDGVLSQLDFVTVSVHSRFRDERAIMTERVCHALENRHVHMLGHPTGRMLLKRAEYEIDMERVFETARTNKVAMELNAHPIRLDLDAGNLRAAIRLGIKIAVNTDAHDISELDYMRYGVFQARRGWVEKKDVLNALSLSGLTKTLSK